MTTQGLLPNDLIDENGLLMQLTKALVERSLQAEMTEHHQCHGLNFDSLNPLPYRSLVIQ